MITAASILLLLLALYFIFFITAKNVPAPIPVSPIQHLEDRKQAIYDNLRDLQFEYRLGKLTDEDYGGNKRALQRELAVVLAEMETTAARHGLTLGRRTAVSSPVAKPAQAPSYTCPHCQAVFGQPLKFCGECGKAMA